MRRKHTAEIFPTVDVAQRLQDSLAGSGLLPRRRRERLACISQCARRHGSTLEDEFPVSRRLAAGGNRISNLRGTEGSNLVSSSGESGANLIFGGECHRWLWRFANGVRRHETCTEIHFTACDCLYSV